MISTDDLLRALNSAESLSNEANNSDDYELSEVLKSYQTDELEIKHKTRYSNGQEKTFSFDD